MVSYLRKNVELHLTIYLRNQIMKEIGTYYVAYL